VTDIVANGTVSALNDPITISSSGDPNNTVQAIAANSSAMVFSLPTGANLYPPLSEINPGIANALLVSNTPFIVTSQTPSPITFSSTFSATVYTADPSCFCAGTRILTDTGELPIEDLMIGDRVITPTNGFRPVKWIGRRSYGGRFVRANPALLPVQIKAGALADGVPRRDLFVSQEHALSLDGVLIPAGKLVNGISIATFGSFEQLDYFHIELSEHDLVFAEGAAAETFADCDNRNMFQNAHEFAELYADAAPPRWQFCQDRVEDEDDERLVTVRQRLADRLSLFPAAATTDPGLHLLVDGRPVRPASTEDGVYCFDVAAGANEIRILSRSAVPSELGLNQDGRRLGISLNRLSFSGGGLGVTLDPECSALCHGFHEIGEGHRWTDGDALLPPSAFAPFAGASFTIEVAADGQPLYPLPTTGVDALRSTAAGRPGHALVIDDRVPVFERDAGSNAVLDHMRALRRMGFAVGFAASYAGSTGTSRRLETEGFKVYAGPEYASVADALHRHGRELALVYLHRVSNAARYANLVRQLCPQARIIYSVADLHWLRLERQARVEASLTLMAEARNCKTRELSAAKMADAVITHSTYEATLLGEAITAEKVHVVPWSVQPRKAQGAWQERRGIAFIGDYRHVPNRDAAAWLIDEIMPLVWEQNPDITCTLVGADMPAELRQRAKDDRIAVQGHVADLNQVFDRVRLTVAPLRYGAGVKGKVLASLAAGMPCVMTPIAAEGLSLPPALDPIVADTATDLATLICHLHLDSAANEMFAAAGLDLVGRQFCESRVDELLRPAALPPEQARAGAP